MSHPRLQQSCLRLQRTRGAAQYRLLRRRCTMRPVTAHCRQILTNGTFKAFFKGKQKKQDCRIRTAQNTLEQRRVNLGRKREEESVVARCV